MFGSSSGHEHHDGAGRAAAAHIILLAAVGRGHLIACLFSGPRSPLSFLSFTSSFSFLRLSSWPSVVDFHVYDVGRCPALLFRHCDRRAGCHPNPKSRAPEVNHTPTFIVPCSLLFFMQPQTSLLACNISSSVAGNYCKY